MVVYKVDNQSYATTSQQIKDMDVVLQEIAPTLQILQKLVDEHSQSVSTPAIDNYRYNLQRAIDGAIKLSKIAAENSQQLCATSDQVTKHLSGIEDQVAKSLA